MKLALLTAAAVLGLRADGGADGCAEGCQYEPQNAQSLVQQWVNFGSAPLVIGDGINAFKWINCPCFTGVFEGGLLQTTADEPGLLSSNQAYLIPRSGEVQLSGTMRFFDKMAGSCNTTDMINMNENPFYGYGSLSAVDGATGWTFGFILTNYKIYAVYGRNAGRPDAYSTAYNFPFTYLVPVAPRWPGALYRYALVFNAGTKSVSYRINDRERLYLDRIGQGLDRKFLVQTNVPSPDACPDSYPESFRIVLGNGRLLETAPGNERVCQLALFDQCAESVYRAAATNCTYGAIPRPFDRAVQLTSVFLELSVVAWDDAFNCREQACRFDCRVPACPRQDCLSSARCSSSSSFACPASSSGPDVWMCPGRRRRQPARSRTSSTARRRIDAAPGSFRGTSFSFNPDWAR